MSGECGQRRSPFPGISANGMSGELAKSASATLGKLNSMMRQMSDWREERLALESNVRRLKSALKKFGENPDEALKPDPLVVDQRLKIDGLELTRDRLEDEVRGLRVALLEADRAITCYGAKRLIEKMRKMRKEAAEERGKLNDEIGHLKLRVREAEDDSSCSSLSRLRVKLREILNGDKKMERIIADVASRSCGTVIDLSNELTRIKELLDESRLENIRLNGESGRLKAALESAPNSASVSGCSGYLETIERLGFHAKEPERKIKEFEDDSGLVKRVGELEDALNESRKEIREREDVATSLRNEILGAKTAYNAKSRELDACQNALRDFEALKNASTGRDELVADLRRELKLSVSAARDTERLRDETNGVKAELLNLEIERDGLLDEIEKMRGIVSDRNEHIVKILEAREGRTEIGGVRNENERLKVRRENLEDDLSKLNETSKASGDRDAPLVKKIKELEEEEEEEEELVELERASSYPVEKDSLDSNLGVKTLEYQVDRLEEPEVKVEKKLSEFGSGTDREKLVARLEERSNELETENRRLRKEVDELEGGNLGREVPVQEANVGVLNSQETQTEDYFGKKVGKLETDNAAFKSELGKVIAERDALKHELRKLISVNNELSADAERSKREFEKLTVTRNEELNEKAKSCEGLTEKLAAAEEQLNETLEEANSLRGVKASLDNLKVENEELKSILKKENEDREELVKRVEKLRSKVEEGSKTPGVGKKDDAEKLTGAGGSKSGETVETALVMERGDYIRADRELKYYIHLQSLAVKRVVDFIGYVYGTTSLKPSMAAFPEPTITDGTVLNLDENVTATFRMSRKLSENIFAAETNVQRLETLKNEIDHLRAERDCLNKGVEKVTEMLSKLGQEIWVPRDRHPHLFPEEHRPPFETGTDGSPRDEAGERSATRKRNHPCAEGRREDEEEKFLVMNRRISSLQRQIELKQREAAQRLIEMRETMRQERIRLMEIADRANVPL